MLGLNLPRSKDADKESLCVLCIGAHCDDIEIGCGGALLKLLDEHPNVELHWHLFASTSHRKEEALEGAHLFGEKAKQLNIEIRNFDDGYLPYYGTEVKEAMQGIADRVDPDVVFTHYRNDLHQDHRKISELTWNSFRNHLILEYEIPKWDGDIGQPNTFVEIDRETAEKKIALLQKVYNSQQQKKWFTDDLFMSVMRIRGMECNASSLLAEAFYTRKVLLSFT